MVRTTEGNILHSNNNIINKNRRYKSIKNVKKNEKK